MWFYCQVKHNVKRVWPHKNVISFPKFYNRIQYNKYQRGCRLRPNVQPAALQQDGINRTCGHEATLRVRWPQPGYVTPNTVSGDPKQEDGASLNPFHTKKHWKRKSKWNSFCTFQDASVEKVETKSVISERKMWKAFHHNCDWVEKYFFYPHALAIIGTRTVHSTSSA